MKQTWLWLIALVPLAAIVVQFAASAPQTAASGLRRPLREVAPRNIPGWIVNDRPIAESDEAKKSVGELLNYDDAVYRRYQRGGLVFDLYAAYWKPGKMSARLVAGHTPDVCWTASGWTMLDHEQRTLANLKGTILRLAQYRVFEFEGARQTVLFWHLSGDELVSYETVGSPPWWAPFRDLAKNGLHQRKQQYFIRISSALPFEQWERDPDVLALLNSLSALVQ